MGTYQLWDKRTLFELFRHVYRGYTVGNHDIRARTVQTVYVDPHSNVLH